MPISELARILIPVAQKLTTFKETHRLPSNNILLPNSTTVKRDVKAGRVESAPLERNLLIPSRNDVIERDVIKYIGAKEII
jgi:hypothetical protein